MDSPARTALNADVTRDAVPEKRTVTSPWGTPGSSNRLPAPTAADRLVPGTLTTTPLIAAGAGVLVPADTIMPASVALPPAPDGDAGVLRATANERGDSNNQQRPGQKGSVAP
jgi:hypothetical protein